MSELGRELGEILRKSVKDLGEIWREAVGRVATATPSKSEKIPYGRESLVGARTEFLRELLPDWKWDPLTRTLTSPNKKIKIHAHFTEISEDLMPYKGEIMRAMRDIREKAFLRIPAGYFVEETALPMFKELAKPYAEVLNKYGRAY